MNDTQSNNLEMLKGLNTIGLFKHMLEGVRWKTTTVLLLTPFLLTTWKYFASYKYLMEQLPDSIGIFADKSQAAELIHFALSLFLLGIVPCLVIKFLFREKLSDYGLQFGDAKHSMIVFALLAPAFVAAAFLAAPDPQIRLEYPLDKLAGQSLSRFGLHALGYFCFYIGWEIYFRGFMQFGTQASFGVWNAILVQTSLSCLLHIGKPTGEIFGSIAGGILWGIIAYRTKSIGCCLLLHATLGILLDAVICYR